MNYRGNNNEACLPENPPFRQYYGFKGMLRRKSKFVRISTACGGYIVEPVKITLYNLGYFSEMETLYTDKSDTPIQYLPNLAEMIKADIWTITITRFIKWENGQTYFYAAYVEN